MLDAQRAGSGGLRSRRPWHVLGSWSTLPSSIDGLVMVPVDLETADPGFLDELVHGQLGLGGMVVDIARDTPFAIAEAPLRWQRELHRFRWLAHLGAAGGRLATELARRLVSDWIKRNRRPGGLAWEPEVLASRITAWLCNAGLVLDGAEPAFFRAVLDSLGAQIRRLDRVRHRLPPGPIRLECLIALLQAALATGAAERHVARLHDEVHGETARQVLPDGSHIGRNPGDVLRLLLALLPLRRCLIAGGRVPPPAVAEAIPRMIAFLRHMRLDDGTLARFNGMGPTRSDLLSTVLSFAGDQASEQLAGGYARLAAGGTTLVVDVARPPPLPYAGAAHAGCLAFEMTVDGAALLRNCGVPAARAPVDVSTARATASHNTLALDARSSARLAPSRRDGRHPGAQPLRGPERVTCDVEETAAGALLTASHDGYAEPHGIVHTRCLRLSADGARLEGSDRLGPRSGVLRLPVDLPFTIHFHLASGVGGRLAPDGQSAMLERSDGACWRLACSGARISIESSVDYARSAGPQPSRQVVLRGTCPGEVVVDWSLEQVA